MFFGRVQVYRPLLKQLECTQHADVWFHSFVKRLFDSLASAQRKLFLVVQCVQEEYRMEIDWKTEAQALNGFVKLHLTPAVRASKSFELRLVDKSDSFRKYPPEIRLGHLDFTFHHWCLPLCIIPAKRKR
jgi:hypothetical protein